MKNLLLVLGLSLFCSTLKAQNDKTAPLSKIISQVSNSWEEVDKNNKTGIELQSISASFSLSNTTSKGGEIKIWIFKLGRKTEKTKVHKVTFDLAKPETTKDTKPKGPGSQNLTDFINSALSDFKKMNDLGIFQDLSKREITLEVGLTITKGKNGGAEYEIGIFTISAEAGKNAEQGNTLTLVFSKKQ